MGVDSPHLLGRDTKFFVNEEATFKTFAKPAAGDGMAIRDYKFTGNLARKDRMDAHQASRDIVERITGRYEYAWATNGFYIPSGTKNVAPDCGAMIKSLLGSETVNANDVTYAQSSSQSLTSFSMVAHNEEWFQEAMWGAICDKLTLKLSGGDEPQIAFEGRAAGGHAITGYTTLNGALSGSETTITIQTVDAEMFPVGSVIKVGTSDGAGAGHEVTGVSGADLTITPAITGAQADSSAVVPFVPTWTDAGVPMPGTVGTITWDSLAIGTITGLDLTIDGQNKVVDDNVFETGPSDFIPGFFNISGVMNARVRKDELVKLLNRAALSTVAVTIVGGGAAQSGTRLSISMPYVEAEWAPFDIPESEDATIAVPFKALGSSGNDAITWLHT